MSGYLEAGQWREGWYDTGKTAGEFVRTTSRFRSWITADGSSGFAGEPGRYHLYVSLACPWAHRTLIARALKGLQDAISVSVVEPVMMQGWSFSDALPDHLYGFQYLHQLYSAADPCMSHAHINPTRIVPVGPRLKFMEDADAAARSLQ